MNILNEKTEIMQLKIFYGIIVYLKKAGRYYNYIFFWINLSISGRCYSCGNSPTNASINNTSINNHY